MRYVKNAEKENHLPKWGLQIFSSTFFDKMYILSFDFKYWKSKIPFFKQNMWDTKWSLECKIVCIIKDHDYFSFLRYLEENELLQSCNLLENYRNVYRKLSASAMMRMCFLRSIEP